MYKFFVEENQIENNLIKITGKDVNHIKNVLRLQQDNEIQIGNIQSEENYRCKIQEINNQYIECTIIEKIEIVTEPNVEIHLFQGLPKADKMESIIQKTTEIGIKEITPVIMARSIVKLEDKTIGKKVERWQKIAEVAAKQSKRDSIPQVNWPINLKNIYENLLGYDIVLVAYEKEENTTIKQALKKIIHKQNAKIAIVIGPEGGMEQEEIEQLMEAGGKIVSLGKRILRTETAPIVVTAIIIYEWEEEESGSRCKTC